MSDELSPSEGLSRPTGYAWVVVGLLCVVALLNYMDRLMLTAMHDPIRAAVPMSDAQFGLLTSAFLWVYAGVSPLGGFLADRVGRRRVIIASLLFWSAATFGTGLARSFHGLLAARALMGLSEACYIPAALALIADYHRGPTRSLATGLHMTGLYAGAALGGMGGVLAERFGWSAGFQLFGGVGVLYGLVLAATLFDPPAAAVRSSSHEDSQAKARLPVALTSLLARPAFWVLLALNVLVGTVNWAVYGWLPTYLKEHFRLGLGEAGMSATGYIQAASFAGVLAAGALADRWARSRRGRGARALVPAVGFLLAAPALAAAAMTDALPVAVAGLVVFGLGRGAFDANQMPLLREIADERYSATGYGLLNLVSTAAGGVMVYAGGALLDAGASLARVFQVAGGALFVASLLLFLVRRATVVGSVPEDAERSEAPAPALRAGC